MKRAHNIKQSNSAESAYIFNNIPTVNATVNSDNDNDENL